MQEKITLDEIQILEGDEYKEFLKQLIKERLNTLLELADKDPECLIDYITDCIYGYEWEWRESLQKTLQKLNLEGLVFQHGSEGCICHKGDLMPCGEWENIKGCRPWRYKNKPVVGAWLIKE